MWFELRRARARLSGDEVPDRGDAPRRTPFSSLSATGTVMDALLTNRDLKGVLDFMTITGTGTVNLLDNAINFDLKATMIDGPTLQSDPGMVKYAGKSLPLKATGTLDAPSVLPDFSAIVTERLQSEVDQRVEQEKSAAQQRLDEQKKEAQEKLQNRLRGLLDR
jgi:AsmA protein